MGPRACEHGVVSGTCVWCMAEELEYESKALEELRQADQEKNRK